MNPIGITGDGFLLTTKNRLIKWLYMKINIIKKLIMKSKKDPSKELKKKEAAAMFKKSLKEIEDDRKDYLKRVEEFKQGKRKYISDTID